MPHRAAANRAAILDAEGRLAIARMALTILVDHGKTTGITIPEERLIYFAALEATVLGRRLTRTKLAEATGIPRTTLTRHLDQLIKTGVILYLEGSRTFAVSAEYANEPSVLARNAQCRRALEKCYAAMHPNTSSAQNGHSDALQDKNATEQSSTGAGDKAMRGGDAK